MLNRAPSRPSGMPPETKEIKSVNIRPGVSVLSILRHLNYKTWFALAEFVDNSIQSYITNRQALEEIHGPSFKLRVRIDIESSEPTRIVISDNAGGIALKDFPRAFRPAEIPPDRTGLSEFGMGMKSAACWFAPRWQVRTSAFNDPFERVVKFDVSEIVNDQLEELVITSKPALANNHLTEITLEQPYHLPIKRNLAKIKEHLSDIYRVYIREGLLSLCVGNEELTYTEPNILLSTFARDTAGKQYSWRKDINFDLGGGLRVTGFAGLMDPMNTSRSGFALFRRRRLIQGSGDEGYRPQLIFGQPGNFRWRRLFGELHLEGFDVSHTKDGFQWDENEQPFLELLKEELDSEELPLLRQADLYRVQVSRNEAADAAQRAIAGTVQALQSSLPTILPIIADAPQAEAQTTPLEPEPTLASREFRITFRDQAWLIRVEIVNDSTQREWVSMTDQPAADSDPQILEIRVSMAHPFMIAFAQTDAETVEALLRVAASIALAEKLARNSGVRKATTVRRNMNEILREALSEI